MSALTQLLAPLPLDRFMEARRPGRWCVIGGPIERLPAWLRAPALNDLVALGLSFRGTGYVNRSVHCHPTEVHYGSDDAKPEVLHAMGMTQTFPNVQRFVPECDAGLAELCGAMGVSRGMFEAHLFVSPRGEGLRWHPTPLVAKTVAPPPDRCRSTLAVLRAVLLEWLDGRRAWRCV